MARKAKRSRGRRGSRGGGAVFVAAALAVLALVVFAAPAFVVFSVGMVPAIVAVIVDRDPARNATIAVSATNLAGVVPSVPELLAAPASLADAVALVTDMFVLRPA